MKRIKINELLDNKTLLKQFCEDMKNGAVAVIPTDTLYGFGVSFNSPEAVQKVYNIKNRDARKPLILFLTHTSEIRCAYRNQEQGDLSSPYLGFRVVLTVKEKDKQE